VRWTATLPVAILLLASCAERMPRADVAAAFAGSISVCAVNADKKAYLGKTVLVRGQIVSNMEYSGLAGRECPGRGIVLEGSLEPGDDPRAWRALGDALRGNPDRRVDVVYRARLDRHHRLTNCESEGCYRYYLVSSLVAVRDR